MIELDPVDRITADAVGPPGERTFYLQARKGDRLLTLVLEKQQVQLLAASVVEILSRVRKETGEGPDEETMTLEEPLLPEWRAGRLSIGYHEERDLVVLEVEELVPENEDAEDDDDEEDEENFGDEEDDDVDNDDEKNDESDDRPRLSDLGTEFQIGVAEAEESGEEEADEAFAGESDEREPDRVRLWATREQMLSLARHGAAVAARGRPRCQLCGNPLDDVHVCPALNGHGKLRSG